MSPSEKAENAGSMKRKHEEVVLGELSSRSIAEVRRSRKDPLYYADYLKLDKILNAQEPLSWKAKDLCHDELLFITIHQTYELWFKQLIFEIDSVRDIFECLRLGEKQISTALHRLNRVKEIQKILVEQIRVLETMTAQEFLNFRDYLFPASGFQSLQFRLLETKLGLKLEKRVNQDFINKLKEEDKKKVEKALSEPSLFDYVERWLRNMPFIEFRGYRFASHYKEAVEKMHNLDSCALNRMLEGEEREAAMKDLASTMEIYESVWDKDVHNKQKELGARRLGFRATNACLMMMLYEDQPMLQLPARLLRVLVDVDDCLNQWRHRHTQMVHRMIGQKIGTGGSLGHRYLKETVDRHRIFSDISNMSTLLLPKRFLPELPTTLRDQMKYFHSIEPYDRTLFELGGGGDNVELDW
eukprot:CAMPEP_0113962892 /NCGR_PEP_ID=MMETSP0011_2-20120614/6195_1 /TAXON_ID=101924 /ORGANISM="Rhodosorus marinus" /LENGTH=412 /DNA_ID=CAMNT_0000974851 /DNA_START=208 /DNA_END=1443 /DNA_ORIENTATION=- /assembly_acc=CAM_ASM_000156